MIADPKSSNPNSLVRFLHSIYDEIVYGPGTKHFLRVLASPIGLLGTFFLILSIFLAFVSNSQAASLKDILWFVFFYMSLAGSWNIIGGYGGEVDFGHVLFVGIGIYTEAILINQYNAMSWFSFLGNNDIVNIYLPLIVTIFLSGILAALVSVIVGIPILKLRGAYFAIAMLAFSQTLAILFLVQNLIPFYNTNGGNGVNVSPLVHVIPNYTDVVYLLIIGVSIVAFIISHYVSYTRLGLSLRAIKGSPDGASSIGINVLRTKLQAFALSAFIAGIAGAVYILALFNATPSEAFDVQVTVQMIIITLLGGPASVFGPIIGAIIIWPSRQILTTSLTGYSLQFFGLSINFNVAYLIVYGLLFVLAVLYLPKGIIGYLEDKKILKRESLLSEEHLDRFITKGETKNE